jgi:hypothetical protein
MNQSVRQSLIAVGLSAFKFSTIAVL